MLNDLATPYDFQESHSSPVDFNTYLRGLPWGFMLGCAQSVAIVGGNRESAVSSQRP